jgi:hypothetical protein
MQSRRFPRLAGAVSLVAGAVAFATTVAQGETILQISGMGPFAITYVNPEDDPRNKKSPSQ